MKTLFKNDILIKIKQKEIEQMGYYCYIIKDMGSFNFKFVKEKFKEFRKFIYKKWALSSVG